MSRAPGFKLSTEHREKLIAAARAANTGRARPPKIEKICETCTTQYRPNASHQRWCEICAPDAVWTRRIQRYGVTKPVWDRMLLEQGERCSLCDEEPSVVDHDHKTGRVRGLLCNGCNSALNRAESAGWLNRVNLYLGKM